MKELPDFSLGRVLVVGDVMLDRYWHGSTQRISPEAPVPVVRINQEEYRPGGAANVALNIASLGGRAMLLGVCGADDLSRQLQDQLQQAGVSCHFERSEQFPTISKLRVVSRHQQLIRLDFEEDFSGYQGEGLLRQYGALLAEVDLVVLSDYGQGTLARVAEFVQLARESGVPVLVDPKGTDFSRYRGATLITPNLAEFEAVQGVMADQADLESKGADLMRAGDEPAGTPSTASPHAHPGERGLRCHRCWRYGDCGAGGEHGCGRPPGSGNAPGQHGGRCGGGQVGYGNAQCRRTGSGVARGAGDTPGRGGRRNLGQGHGSGTQTG